MLILSLHQQIVKKKYSDTRGVMSRLATVPLLRFVSPRSLRAPALSLICSDVACHEVTGRLPL